MGSTVDRCQRWKQIYTGKITSFRIKGKKKKNRQRVYRPGSPFDIRIADRLGMRGVDLLSRVHKRGWVQNWALVESWKRREPGIVGFRLYCQLVSSQWPGDKADSERARLTNWQLPEAKWEVVIYTGKEGVYKTQVRMVRWSLWREHSGRGVKKSTLVRQLHSSKNVWF